MAFLSALVIFVSFMITSETQETCSRIVDISGEPNLQFRNLRGLWYIHIQVDTTGNAVLRDAKLFFDSGPQPVREYYFGRNTTSGRCTSLIYSDTQPFPNRPCVISQQIEPDKLGPINIVLIIVPLPANELVYTLLSRTRLVIFGCLTGVGGPCESLTVGAALTRRPELLPGEIDVFAGKFRELGLNVQTSDLVVEEPTANNCEEDFLLQKKREKRLQKLRRKYQSRRKYRNKPRRKYRY